MQATPSHNLPITEDLWSIAKRDIQGRYISPKADVQTRLAQEIERSTGCSRATLAPHAKELLPMRVSAEPQKFVRDTLNAIEKISADLREQKATKFEIRFVNPQGDPQWWGDQILVGVRYLT
jgi:hypothetical protein